MLREHRRFFLWTSLAGFALRLFFFIYFSSVSDDSRVYLDLAKNWLQHGVYGQTQLGQIVPADTRLPGYPAFLAAISAIFGGTRMDSDAVGSANIRAVLMAQILIDLGTCLIIADLARRIVPGGRAGRSAFFLAAMCPFMANYAAAVLSETLEIFFTALALDCAVAAVDRRGDSSGALAADWSLWVATGTSIAACILLRPDGGILLAAVLLYIAVAAAEGAFGGKRKQTSAAKAGDANDPLIAELNRATQNQVRPAVLGRPDTTPFRRLLGAGIIVTLMALAPLVPWTIRNFRTLHHFQPLAPRYANESDEAAPRGFNRWVKTWIADYVSVEEIYWSVPGDKIDVAKLPSRALDAERERTLAVIEDYNQSQELTPQMDARFGELAAMRIRAHPLRYYVELPMLRIADMWLRPRTEFLPPDARWWEFNDDIRESVLTVGFGLLNLHYLAAALLALVRRHARIRYLGLLVTFLVLRTAFLATIENPEPRYTLEGYPVIIVLASALSAKGRHDDNCHPARLA